MVGRCRYLRARSILGVTSIASSNEEAMFLGELSDHNCCSHNSPDVEFSNVSSVAGYAVSVFETPDDMGESCS
jgi:hypothetical protein